MLELEVGSLPTTSNSTSSGRKVVDVLLVRGSNPMLHKPPMSGSIVGIVLGEAM